MNLPPPAAGPADVAALAAAAARAEAPAGPLRGALERADRVLNERYLQGRDIAGIVGGRAEAVDRVLAAAWRIQPWPDQKDIALLAVGGYGRGELLPHSDIDLLILTRRGRPARYQPCIGRFLALLWDIGLQVGQSVRSLRQCREEAVRDITVATALMESRPLAGAAALHGRMLERTRPPAVWPTRRFVRAKLDEQAARHARRHDVDHALEPDVKMSPGGLRDIQTVAWAARRHFGSSSFRDLVELGFLTRSEAAALDKGRRFLWKLRYGLHHLSGRREDRLLFDRQRELARLFGHEDDERSLGVEKLMQRYYRTVGSLRALNDMLLQHLDEAILRAGERSAVRPLNPRFQTRGGCIEVRDAGVFKRSPSALLEIFVLMARDPDIRGIRASTIRLLRDSRRLVDGRFRGDARNAALFMELLRSPCRLTLQLRRMARYGILGRYLPEFGRIIGQMQHDLFHVYTVDAHTLQVIENMRRLLRPEALESLPDVARVARNLPKIELLYIAGLYHDIAKGRGGDHSELGRADAEAFCRRHRLSDWDAALVAWLVEQHLLMSMTAQRKDIFDPEAVREFAGAVGDKLHLDYLYALTVTDIRATNPGLWNSWRATLLRELYRNARRALRAGLDHTVNRSERIADKKDTARGLLREKGLEDGRIDGVWAETADEYFVRESAANIAWHTEAISRFEGGGPLVSIKAAGAGPADDGATQVFICAPNADCLFARATAAFERLNLDICGARVFTSAGGRCMDTFAVLEADGGPVGADPARREEIAAALRDALGRDGPAPEPVRRLRSRKARHFDRPVETSLMNQPGKDYSTLEISCPDHPGILAGVGQALAENGIELKDARIATLGERVEDLFFVTDRRGRPIADAGLIERLQNDIKARLHERLSA